MTDVPERVVSLVPSTTESICLLGATEVLVGRTRYCTEPAGLQRRVPSIGGTKNPDIEAVLGLRPDLVVANAEENRAEDLERLATRVPVLVQTPKSVVEATGDLRALANRLDRLEAAEPFLRRIEARVAAAAAEALGGSPRSVYYAIWRKPWMTVNRDTFVHDVLALCGARSVAADAAARYPELCPEQAVSRGVELVLLASEPWEFDEAQRAEVAAARWFGDAEVRLVDGRDFCWHGARMADGLGRALDAVRS